ncbi:hypothetical protein GAO09_20325 [Rhizobiales bacterium RZME27]|uniref:Uncharacterized protein n=1 Tax=Endobacterium cereale TaxID=2663029 RepID=A0A6A8AB01_9HYPH|nr:hypothetical protein [Endobacterium cereale]MEB2846171.1 hypothetical protein [Endobacterium cereale]MQY48382.1 hypothetical protein [Endobacterium cereale]
MPKTTIDQFEGGAALCEWFGGIPSFHDATLSELELRQGAASRMVFKAFRITPETDAAGYFIQEKHVTVTLMLFGLQSVQLAEIMEAGIVFSVDFERDDEGVTLLLKASYGAHGCIRFQDMAVAFEPAIS